MILLKRILCFKTLLTVLFCFSLLQKVIETSADKRQTPSTTPTIEYFGAEKGFAVGSDDVVFLAIVRNRTNGTISAALFRLRCYAVNGLDYTSGETMPILPELAPNQAVAYRWRLSVSEGRQILMAAALLQKAPQVLRSIAADAKGPNAGIVAVRQNPVLYSDSDSTAIQTSIAVVPRIYRNQTAETINIKSEDTPAAAASSTTASIMNNLVGIRFTRTNQKSAIFTLYARKGTTWSALANGMSMGAVLASEPGQKPWWEVFRWKETQVFNEKDHAVLSLSGTYGNRLKAEMTFEAHRDYSAIDAKIRFTAMQTIQCSGIRLPEILVERDKKNGVQLRADGTPIFCENEVSLLADSRTLSAVRRDAVTFGMTWSTALPLNGLVWHAVPVQDSQLITLIGGTATAVNSSETVLAGKSFEVNYRIFAYAPSATIKDAFKFIQQ